METACGVPGDSAEHALHVQRLTQLTLSIAFPNPVRVHLNPIQF